MSLPNEVTGFYSPTDDKPNEIEEKPFKGELLFICFL